jgi:hypothetical protein
MVLNIQESANTERYTKHCMIVGLAPRYKRGESSAMLDIQAEIHIFRLLQQHSSAEKYKGSNDCHYCGLPLSYGGELITNAATQPRHHACVATGLRPTLAIVTQGEAIR